MTLPILSAILLVIGVSGFVGTTVHGSTEKTRPHRKVAVIALSMAAVALALVVFGGSVALVFALLACLGSVANGMPIG
jgi:predicted MFS family arabinose efflux permease